jgi:hypothetical protein
MEFEDKAAVMALWQSTYDGLLAGQPDGRYVTAYDQLFAGEFTAAAVDSLSAGQRQRLLNILLNVSTHSSGQKYLQQLLLLTDAVLANGEAQEWQVQSVHYLLVSRRDFLAANRFAARTGLKSISFNNAVLIPGVKRTALYFDSKLDSWERRELDINRGSQIVVLSSPMCPPCEQAAREIANDPELSRVFREHSLWLAPTHTPLDDQYFRAWSNAHPEFRTTAIYDPDEWPAAISVELQATPTFFFLVDGKLKKRVLGWPSHNGKTRIVDPLRNIGLLKP